VQCCGPTDDTKVGKRLLRSEETSENAPQEPFFDLILLQAPPSTVQEVTELYHVLKYISEGIL
jgi:hypothetical protein